MHNLLLGTAKHALTVWIANGLITQSDLALIQEKTEKIKFPYDTGRVPTKIGSSFSGFTADQWRLWTISLSPVVLKGIIPDNHLRCWLLFVQCCSLLCRRVISVRAVEEAHTYLVQFCRKFEHLYGEHNCTPNMHLHMHLKSCLLDYGPVYAFWCFPFERFNGKLNSYHTNKRSVEVQIMKKFIKDQNVRNVSFPENFKGLEDLLKVKSSGSVRETMYDSSKLFLLMNLTTSRDFTSSSYAISDFSGIIKMIPPTYEKIFTNTKCNQLKIIYSQLYKGKSITFFYQKCKRVEYGNELLGSKGKDSVIMAYWPESGTSLDNIDYSTCHVGVVQYFYKHSVSFDQDVSYCNKIDHLFCNVLWKQPHPSVASDYFGRSAIVTSNISAAEDAMSFMPIQRIVCRCASGEVALNTEGNTAFVACPVGMRFTI